MNERDKNMIIDIKKYCMKETSFLKLMDDEPYVFSIDFYIGKEGKITAYCDFEKSEFKVETYDADDVWKLKFDNFKDAVNCVRHWSYEISNGFSDFNARDVQHMIDIYDKYQEMGIQ